MLAYRKAEVEHTAKLAADERFPVFPPHLVQQVRDCMPEDGIICLDNGVYKIWFARGYTAYLPNTVLLDNALATMGAGLPSAMMSAMLYPERKVMAICGDGGFMMNSQEMETAVRLRPQPDGADPARRFLRHDPLEAGQHGLQGLGPDLRQPRFRRLRQQLRSQRPPRGEQRSLARTARHLPRHARACT